MDRYKLKVENSNGRSKGNSLASISTGASTSINMDAKVNLELKFLRYLKERGGGVTTKSDLDIYLYDGMEKRDKRFDILNWWKVNSSKYPVLSQVARHVLRMPTSTIALESAFSTGGRVIDLFRSSLTTKTAKALICTQDWIGSTPINLELPIVHDKAIEELQEKMENFEIGVLEVGPKFFPPCAVDD
ncbi:hypothetical protein OROHE_001127 [Orobanche hederae]